MSSNADGDGARTAGKVSFSIPGIGTVELSSTLPTLLVLLGAVGVFLKPQLPQVAICGAILCIGLLWWTIDRLTRPRSVLVKPAAPRSIQSTFVGRDAETSELTTLVLATPVVWITGESGAGKSWLVSKGLLPSLKSHSKCVPLCMDRWDADWEQGLTRALASALEASSKEGPSIADVNDLEAVFAALRHLLAPIGTTAILVFDQFDDYLIQHRDRFLSRSGRCISSEKLRATNRFWEELGKLIFAGSAHCVFVLRQDLQWGRSSLGFQDRAEDFFVSRLHIDVVEQLIGDVISGGAITHPEISWLELRAQICRDLADPEGVLPIQMRFAIESLYVLKDDLSVGNYRKRGGIGGLVAEHLRGILARTDRRIGGGESVWLSLLFTLTDGRKTRSLTESELLAADQGRSLTNGKLIDGLAFLKQNEIVRDIVEVGDRTRRWRLDHDYLVEVISYLRKQQSPLQHELLECRGRWEAAATVRGRIGALLQPGTLYRVLWSYVRGRITIGSARRYVWWSVARLLTTSWVIIPIVTGAVMWAWYVNRETSSYFDVLGVGVTKGQDEAQALWDLARQPRAIRAAVLNRFFDNETNSARYVVRSVEILSAVAGTSQREWTEIVSNTLRRCTRAEELADSRTFACGSLWLKSGDRNEAADFFKAAVGRHKMNDSGIASAMLLGYVARPQDTDLVLELIGRLLPMVARKDNPESTRLLGGLAIASLGRVLSDLQRADVALKLVEPISDETDRDLKSILVDVFKGLGSGSDPGAHDHLLVALVSKASAEPDPSDKPELLRLIGIIKTESQEDAGIVAPIVQRLRSPLANGVQSQNAGLTPYLAGLASLKIRLSALESATVDRYLDGAGSWGGASTGIPGGFAADRSCTEISSRVENTGPILSSVNRTVLRQLGRQFVRSMKYSRAGWCEEASADLAPVLDPDLVSAAIDGKLQVLEKRDTDNPIAFVASILALKALCAVAPRAESEGFANRLLNILEADSDSHDFSEVLKVFRSLAPTLSSGSTSRLLGSVIRRMDRDEDAERQHGWADIIGAIGPNLEDTTAAAALGMVIPHLITQVSPNCGALASLIRVPTIGQGIRVVRWPTCSGPDRSQLVSRILELVGRRPETAMSIGGQPAFNDIREWLEFMKWLHSDARKQHICDDPDATAPKVTVK